MKKIVMVENQEFNSDVKIGAHHYAELFAKNGYEVLWLSPAYSMAHYFNDKELTNHRKKLHSSKRVELSENIYGYAPFTLIPFINVPVLNSGVIGKRFLYTSIPNLKKELNKIGFGDVDILWISNIKSYYIKEFITYKKLVHRLADEKTGFKGFFKTLENFERKLIIESDLVFSTAKLLENKAREVRNDVVYLPNAVKYEDFQKENYLLPIEYKRFQKSKRCVYIGAIAEWLDKELIEYIVSQLNDVQFFFIGPDHGGLKGLEKYKNLHIVGPKEYSSLPNFLFFSDVAIIPFKVNKLTDAINPVKLFEYLAAGTPTLTTSFNEVKYIKGPFEIATNQEEFLGHLKMMLTKKFDKNLLKDFAKNNDWSSRYEIIEQELVK
ncbi:GumK N-terminal domain-containing glycosyltransferase [Peribacillus phoenicis]|uniref:GumK N-terminal domain-containing glycosyltransferase n=1 Tax=unclassified Peribacillus TaxID=2675266 RepID=UPI0039A3067D